MRSAALQLYQIVAGMLLAYGLFGGLRVENAVLWAGAAAVAIGLLASWSIEGQVVAWWGTLFGLALVLVIAGLDTIRNPECGTPPTLGCVPAGRHSATIAAVIALIAAGVIGAYSSLRRRRPE